jgi:hypothetical protein
MHTFIPYVQAHINVISNLIYVYIFQVASSVQTLLLKLHMHFPFLLSHVRLSQLPRFYKSKNIWYSINQQAPKCVIFSSLLLFLSSYVKIFSWAPCSQTLSILCASHMVRDQVSNSFKSTGEITISIMYTWKNTYNIYMVFLILTPSVGVLVTPKAGLKHKNHVRYFI